MTFIIIFCIAATIAAAALVALAAVAGNTRRRAQSHVAMVESVNRELPQLQCGECGYPACRPYAEAIVSEQVPIHLCPPGGQATVARLAQLLNVEPETTLPQPPPQVAVIRTRDCVGCGLCLPVCPTDAIVGTAQYAHQVLTADCVGCGLCLAPCPVDCIDLHPAAAPPA